MLQEGEVWVDPFENFIKHGKKNDGHAETILRNYAKKNNYTLKEQPVGASRPICDDCRDDIKEDGMKNETPFKNDN